jgi:hypothetical protein
MDAATAQLEDRSQPQQELTPFKLPHGPNKVFLKKVSPFLLREIQKKFPPPRPPVNLVEYDGRMVEEENPADPAYKEALDAHNVGTYERMMRLAILRGIHHVLTPAQRAETNELRKQMKNDVGVELEGTDEFVYLAYIVLADPRDARAVMDAIFSRSQPTEAAISEAAETFRR